VQNLSQYPNVTVIPKGLWSSETELRFKSEKRSSSFVFDGELFQTVGVLSVTTLDKFFEGKPESE